MTPLNLLPWRSLSHIHPGAVVGAMDFVLRDTWAPAWRSLPHVPVLRDTWAPAWRDLLSSMSLASRVKPQMLGADAPSLMISCGLALRGFDA